MSEHPTDLDRWTNEFMYIWENVQKIGHDDPDRWEKMIRYIQHMKNIGGDIYEADPTPDAARLIHLSDELMAETKAKALKWKLIHEAAKQW